MHWLIKGLLCGLLFFACSQAWHFLAGTRLAPLHIAVDAAQWLFAGFCCGVFFRSRDLVRATRTMSDDRP
jgi:hypothetical protein